MKALGTKDPAEHGSMPLSIDDAAQRLAERKREVRARSAAFNTALRNRLTSLDMFLLAGGAGFMLGQHGKRRGTEKAEEPAQAPEVEAEDNLFGKVAMAILVRALA